MGAENLRHPERRPYPVGYDDVGAATTDTYTLSLSFDPTVNVTSMLNQGKSIYVAMKDASGNFSKPATAKRFIVGPWNKAYPVGTYGVDPNTNTAWQVTNQAGDFAVVAQ